MEGSKNAHLSSLLTARTLPLLVLIAAAHGASVDQADHGVIRTRSRVPEAGEITELPGWRGSLPSQHFGGYITVDEEANRNLYYYLIESEGDPARDPVVLWLNGGPGCSSFDGLLYEHGFANIRWADARRTRPLLEPNPWRWSRAATIVYLDSPAGTGLSFSDDPGDYDVNDSATTADSEVFLRRFFKRYPHLAHRNFYIAGESYAGIYVPLLVQAVVDGNRAGHKPHIHIKGYLVGNGCTDEAIDGNAFPPFMVGKSLISARLYSNIQHACRGNYWNATQGTKCGSLLGSMLVELADLNIYDILDECHSSGDWQQPQQQRQRLKELLSGARSGQQGEQEQHEQQGLQVGEAQHRQLQEQRHEQQAQPRQQFSYPLGGGVRTGAVVRNWGQLLGGQGLLGHNPPCIDSSEADAWLNTPSVRRALHAAPVSVTGRWTICSDKLSYTHDRGSMIPVHKELLRKHGLRALVYSGDMDACVPHTGSEAWTAGLGLPIKAPWQPWYAQVADNTVQVAGYTVAYEGLTYATVKGAGHMVPQRRPVEALTMFTRFVHGEDLHTTQQAR